VRRASRVAAAILIAVASAACGSSTSSFAASGPCVADGRAPGAYPELERIVIERWRQVSPDALASMLPTKVDSGRNCTAATLGTLASHGITEVRFAGATWDEGGGNATVSAILTAPDTSPPLDAAWVEEFYLAGARSSSKAENIQTSRPTIGSLDSVYRIDALNDLSLQTVVVWPVAEGVRVVIVSTTVTPDASRADHDRRVVEGVEGVSLTPAGRGGEGGTGPVVVSAA
jgi:hypothetical protein